jgi:hypothetical protein
MSSTPVDLSATDVSFAIIEALRPWSSAVYRGRAVRERREKTWNMAEGGAIRSR